MAAFRPIREEIIALLVALAGFVIKAGDSSETRVNGRVTSSHSYNYAAVLLGGIAIVLVVRVGLRIYRGQVRALAGPPPMHYAGLVAIALLGVYQIVHGLDFV